MNNPCSKSCEGRSSDCHTYCDSYRLYAESQERKRQEKFNKSKVDSLLIDAERKRGKRGRRHGQ